MLNATCRCVSRIVGSGFFCFEFEEGSEEGEEREEEEGGGDDEDEEEVDDWDGEADERDLRFLFFSSIVFLTALIKA